MSTQPALNLILDDLEDQGMSADPDALFLAFSSWAEEGGRPLYPHQEEAALAILCGQHVIAATPTGSGKSLIALVGLLRALMRGERAYYTAPLKALVSEKFFYLVMLFGAENVGMITGDISLNAEAPIICATAEILANEALRSGTATEAGVVVMDEFHFYADPQRGWAWQVPLLELTNAQMILLSATLGDVSFFVKDMQERTGRDVAVVTNAPRPVPLEMEYVVETMPDLLERLVTARLSPVYLVNFSQQDAVSAARSLAATSLVGKEGQRRLKEAIGSFQFGKGFGKTLAQLLPRGIGVHHAGMLPRYRRLVERLTQEGLLVVVSGTDTLGVGINVPIRTVVFTGLTKFDGRRLRHLSAREFHQIAGRAGRAGFDDIGYVKVLAPDWEVENSRQAAKALGSGTKRKPRIKKPPEGQVNWTKATFERLQKASPEALTSRFHFTHAMVLAMLQRPEPDSADLIRLAMDNHDRPTTRNPHLRQLGDIYHSLRVAEIVERAPAPSPGERRPLRLVKELPDDFALNQALSPFALATMDLLDPADPSFVLDLVSVLEAVLEDPRPLLIAQQKAARGAAIGAWKAQGMDYHDRMAALEEVTWPRPLAEVLEPAFAQYRQSNPWVADQEISPKSVVREMVENAMTFTELISRYDLARSEGVVLRYLVDAYRALRQVVPAELRTDEVVELTTWLSELVRAVDSSLLDEWEDLEARQRDATNGAGSGEAGDAANESGSVMELAFGADASGKVAFTRNRHALRVALRNAVFQRVELMAADRVVALAALGDQGLGELAPTGWDESRWDEVLGDYWAEYDWLGTTGEARASDLFTLTEDLAASAEQLVALGVDAELAAAGRYWFWEQVLCDPAEDRDWALRGVLDLAASDERDDVVLRLLEVGPRGS